ncbi:CPBP family intramembrane metalloprotease [Chryseolinea sp. Jin1]|uniref:CPBP family intramembrane metalloprotease n=2 Tax=Chryseolinea lacunae TaxID=2801331 RepID=A0ABS1KVD6_9BACT|nr:CPBP family intramembrane metalloprotease [Chryseolinea lacunae]
MEEIAFRSYPLLKLKRTMGLWPAQLIISVAFILYHISLGWSILTASLGPGVWAFVFGIAAIRSKGIALPTGIHVGLNLTLSILGMNQGVESLFVTSQNDNVSNSIFNLLTRVLVLSAGIFLTECFIRKSKNENRSSEIRLPMADNAD